MEVTIVGEEFSKEKTVGGELVEVVFSDSCDIVATSCPAQGGNNLVFSDFYWSIENELKAS